MAMTFRGMRMAGAAMIALVMAPVLARALTLEVALGDVSAGLRPTPAGVVFDPHALAVEVRAVVTAGAAEVNGAITGRVVAGEDGLPAVMLRIPHADPMGTQTVAIPAHERAAPIPLAAPLMHALGAPAGDGAPAARLPAPVRAEEGAPGPAILASAIGHARGQSESEILVRVGWMHGATLEVARSFTLAIDLERDASPVVAERIPAARARYARAMGRTGTETEPLRTWHSAPPAARLTPTRDGGPVEVVIVTNAELAPELERLADFRTRLGHRALVRTVEWIDGEYAAAGLVDRAARIRAFLAAARAEWGTLWVLLAGDSDVIPPRYAASSYYVEGHELIPADLYYAALDGNWNADGDALFGEPEDEVDLVPDLFAGRAPLAMRAEARAFVERQIAHEMGVDAGSAPGGSAFPASAVFLAEELFESLDGAEVAEEVRQLLTPAMTTVRLYERSGNYPGSLPESRESALAALAAGSGIVLHVGHGFRNTLSVGAGSLANSDCDALSNRPRLPVFLALNCTSAAIDFNSIGERLVRNPRGGAAVYVGSSRFAFPGTARLYQTAFFHAAFQETLRTAGEAVFHARTLLAPLAAVEGAHRWTHFTLTVLGDPMTPLFTRAPVPLLVRHPAVLATDVPATPVIRVSAAGAPVPDALVALLAGDGTLVTGLTDDTGAVGLGVPAGAPGPYFLAASHPDTWPAFAAIASAAGGAFLSPGDPVVSSDDDGDHTAEPAETVELWVPVQNLGGSGAAGGEMRIQVAGGPASVLTGTATIPALGAGLSAPVGPFRLAIDSGAEDGAVVALDVTLTVPAGTFAARRALAVAGPALALRGHTIDGNGVIEPGETVRYALRLANDGAGTARAVTARAELWDRVTGLPPVAAALRDSTARFGDLRRGEVTEGEPFILTLDGNADPTRLELRVDIETALGPGPSLVLDFVAPTAPVGLHTRGSDSAIVLAWDPVAATDLLGYEVERAPRGGAFQRITTRPVAEATLTDSGLASLSTFEYRVTAVDASGNRSPVSAVVEGTTNPALHPGWPAVVGQESASSPLLADLDGDGAAEILTGADAIYVWHGDGTELRDGDGTAVTNGVFSIDGVSTGRRGFHSAPLVANLDLDPELELAGVAWDRAQVFAWNRDGSRVPGWPQDLAGPPNWGSPAAGDLDGDGDLELVVVCGGNGAVYAWHHDGTEVRDGDNDPLTRGVLLATGAAFSFASPALADLDGDGGLEVIVGLDEPAGFVHALKTAGGEAPGFPVALGGRISASPALGDLTGDSQLEIAIAVEDDSLHVLRSDGTPAPGWPRWAFVENAPARTSSPVLADLDGDGRPEIVFAENSGPAHLARLLVFRPDGSLFPGFESVTFATDIEAVGARATQSSPVVGDVDGDPGLEILLGAEDGRVYGWNDNGSPVAGFPIQTDGEVRGSAALGDVDGDGDLEAAVLSWDKQLYVWDLEVPVRPERLPWPSFRHDAQNSGNVEFAAPPVVPVPAPGTGGGAGVALTPALFAPAVLAAGDPAMLEVALGRGGEVRIKLYGVGGRRLGEVFRGTLGPGRHRVAWNGRAAGGRSLAAGVYWLDLTAPGGGEVRRLLVLR